MNKPHPIIILLALASSCCVCKPAPTHQRDSTVIHIVDSLVVRDSVILVPLPQEQSSAILPAMLPSHLETSLAVSDAFVDSIGLHHTLTNKPSALPAHVPVTEHHEKTDSVVIKEVVKEVEVEKPLSWAQTTKIGAFWWLVGGLLLALLWIFRKPLLKLLKP